MLSNSWNIRKRILSGLCQVNCPWSHFMPSYQNLLDDTFSINFFQMLCFQNLSAVSRSICAPSKFLKFPGLMELKIKKTNYDNFSIFRTMKVEKHGSKSVVFQSNAFLQRNLLVETLMRKTKPVVTAT